MITRTREMLLSKRLNDRTVTDALGRTLPTSLSNWKERIGKIDGRLQHINFSHIVST